MASKSSNKSRKRVEAESTHDSSSSSSLKRAKDGSAFSKCEECHKDVPVALISFHNCSLESRIKMNLDTTVIELKKKAPAENKPKKSSEPKPKKAVAKKDGKKRPATAFFIFMNDFRKTFKEENPECKSVATVAKEGGVKWKALSDEERKVYADKAAQLKADYEKEVAEEKEKEASEEKEDKIVDLETDDEKEVEEEKEDAMDGEEVEDVEVEDEKEDAMDKEKEDGEKDDE